MMVTAMLALAACTDGSAPTAVRPSAPPAANSSAPPPRQANKRPGEQAFRNLAEQVPGFAGFYFDEHGVLAVLLTDLGHGASARAALAPFVHQLGIERGRGGRPAPRVVLQQARYSFQQLSEWRERVREPLFALDAVVLLDLDERDNRLFIGLSNESARAATEARLRELGIPSAAYTAGAVTPPMPLGTAQATTAAPALSGCGQLDAYCRPLMGGYKITYFRDVERRCTIGFTALAAGQPRFVTASHCSQHEWSTDYTAYHQPEAYSQVGTEVSDPRGWTCDFLGTWKCRYSDANLVQPSVDIEVGYIGRPTALQSITVNASTPRFVIAGKRDASAGERVYVVGHSTGLHTGTVQKTCTEYKGKIYDEWGLPTNSWHRVLCSDVADYNSVGGDSGGPVFLWDGVSNEVTLVGTNYARNSVYDHAFFNPISGIQKDLGALEVRAPEHRTTPSTGSDDGGISCPPGGCPIMY